MLVSFTTILFSIVFNVLTYRLNSPILTHRSLWVMMIKTTKTQRSIVPWSLIVRGFRALRLRVAVRARHERAGPLPTAEWGCTTGRPAAAHPREKVAGLSNVVTLRWRDTPRLRVRWQIRRRCSVRAGSRQRRPTDTVAPLSCLTIVHDLLYSPLGFLYYEMKLCRLRKANS